MARKNDSSSENEYYKPNACNYGTPEQNADQYNLYYNQIVKNDISEERIANAYNQTYPLIAQRRRNNYSYYSANLADEFKKKSRQCHNCKVTNSPSWRKSPCGKYILCNACGLYAKLHNRPRPFVSMRDGRTRVVKRQPSQSFICYFCKETKGIRPRLEANGRMSCDFCWNNFLMQTQMNYQPPTKITNVNYNNLYQRSMFEQFDPNQKFTLYYPTESLYDTNQMRPNEDQCNYLENQNFFELKKEEEEEEKRRNWKE